jgi:UDP-GlcNAc:undecaprenyl-phosphate GlcNAc-1-phosphate transferase
VGLLDDVHNLAPRFKLLGQAVFVLAFTFFGFHFQVFHFPGFKPVNLGILSVPLTAFWILSVVNAFNMIDGMDGLAATVSAGSLFLLACAAAFQQNDGQLFLALGALGAVLGFLPFNWKPAKVYLGDAGSGWLGMFLACSLTALGQTFGQAPSDDFRGGQPFHYQILLVTLFVAYPALEIALSVTRRSFRGSPVWRADRGHIHHRLLKFGWKPPSVCLMALGLTLLPGFSGLAAMQGRNGWSVVFIFSFSLLVGLGLSSLGYLNFMVDKWTDHLRPHYRIAHLYITMQKEKLRLAKSRDEVLALVHQACREFGVRCFQFQVAPDKRDRGGLEYRYQTKKTRENDPNEYYDYCENPGQGNEAFWVFSSHTSDDELDVECRVLMHDFMRLALESCRKLGAGLENLLVPKILDLPHHKTSGHHLRKRVPVRPDPENFSRLN